MRKRLPKLRKKDAALDRLKQNLPGRQKLLAEIDKALDWTGGVLPAEIDHYSFTNSIYDCKWALENEEDIDLRSIVRLMSLPMLETYEGSNVAGNFSGLYFEEVRAAAVEFIVDAFAEAEDATVMQSMLMEGSYWDFWMGGQASSNHAGSISIWLKMKCDMNNWSSENILLLGAGAGEIADAIAAELPEARISLLELDPGYCISAQICGHALLDNEPTDITGDWGERHSKEFDVVVYSHPAPELLIESGGQIAAQIVRGLKADGTYMEYSQGRVRSSGLANDSIVDAMKARDSFEHSPVILPFDEAVEDRMFSVLRREGFFLQKAISWCSDMLKSLWKPKSKE